MSKQELDRYKIIEKVLSKELKQKKAAELLGISTRQLRNLQLRVKQEGAGGVISKSRGKPGNRKKSPLVKQKVLSLIKEKYEDFGPTLAREKLEQLDNIKISTETLRLWMIETNQWIPKVSRKKAHLSRPRRDCFGELIQVDGSPEYWFGQDMPRATAIVFIDDATSLITSLIFSEQETTGAYFMAMQQHIEKYGIPRALYTDKYSVFKPNKGNKPTQFHRALKELDAELILANSPQAKGRVERANRTLQDRLIKEFRLRGIKTINEANRFANEFIEELNKKFSKKPKSNIDAHRSSDGYDVKRILSTRETRTVLADCTFQYNKTFFLIQNVLDVRRLSGRKINIYQDSNGKIRCFLKDKELEVKCLSECLDLPELSRKEVLSDKGKKDRAQPSTHPWKNGLNFANEKVIRAKIKEEMELVI